MTEPKTLEDFRDYPQPSDFEVSAKELRQEAIKWIKYYRELCLFSEAVSLGKFFNITEEDLK